MTLPTKLGKTNITYSNIDTLFNNATGFISSFDYTCNPYKGCSFACSYCYARYFAIDVERIKNWGDWVDVKRNAIEIIKDMPTGKLDGKTIYMSSVTDPYQPIEQKLQLTRSLLYYMALHHKPKLVVQTRGPLVTRDIDMLTYIQQMGGQVQVNVTITTDNDEYRRVFEPRCPSTPARLKAVKTLNDAGIQTCVTLAPLLLLENVSDFTKRLKDTGCTRFITQPFHMNNYGQEKQILIAQTSEEAVKLMASWLQISEKDFPKRYKEVYNYYEGILLQELPNLGIGRNGFKPPF